MALSYIGSTADLRATGQAESTSAVTIANTGALLVVNMLIFNSGGSTVVVSDGTNGTYSTAGSVAPDSSSQAHQAYFANATAASVTVTVNPAGSSADIEFWTSEVTGAATSSPLDSESGSATGALPTDSGATMTVTSAGTLDQAANIVFAVGTHTGTDHPLTAGNIGGSAATTIGENEDNDGGQCGHVEYRIIASASALTSTITIGSASGVAATWGIYQGIYKEAAAAGAVSGALLVRSAAVYRSRSF